MTKMQCFLILLTSLLVLEASAIEQRNVHDVLCNQLEPEDDVTLLYHSSRRSRRDTVLEESEEFYDDEQERKEAEGLLRRKRNEVGQKREVDTPPGYSIFEIPKLPDKSPMPVFIHLNISKVLDWDELNEKIKIDMEFKMMWTDFKILQFHNNTHPGNGVPLIDTLSNEFIKKNRRTNNNPALLLSIWKPNLFMEGLLSVRQPILMARPLTIRFIPELGWFEYITRIQASFDCSMNFRLYPADTQTCELSIRGFSYTKADLNLTWYKNGIFLNDLSLQSFDAQVDELTHYDLVKSDDPDEVHDVLGFKIIARRKLSYHLVQTYLASSFYIVITTLCFLLPSTMVEARIGISMTTLLTLTAMFGAVRESTPIVSYTKAIDTWMVGCIFFVFLTLFQFTFHIWLKHVRKSKLELDGVDNGGFELTEQNKTGGGDPDAIGPVFSPRTLRYYERMADFLEAYSFPIFLMIFVTYSVGYWSWLLTASDYFNWNINATLNNIQD